MAISTLEKPKPLGPNEELELQQKKKALEQTAVLQRLYDKEKTRQKEREKKERKTDESRIKILLLGAKHLASHIVFAMRNHATFTVVDRVDPEYIYQNPLVKKEVARRLVTGFQVSEMDVERNLSKILERNEFDFVINTLAVHDSGFSANNPIYTSYVNTVFTHGVMNAIAENREYNKNMKFLHISSDKVYGDVGCPAGLNNDPDPVSGYWRQFMIDEDEPPNPLGVKAISRYNQEILVKQLCKTYDIDYMILRVGNLWGRYTSRTNMLNQMIESAVRTHTIHIYGDPWASRHLLNIEDFAEFLRDLLNKNYDRSNWNEIYNIGGHCPLRTYVWGYAKFVQIILSGAPQAQLDPKAPYVLDYLSVKVQNSAPRFYEDTEEAGIRMWLNTKKAEDKLGLVCERDIKWDVSFKELFLFDAAYYIGYDKDQITQARERMTYEVAKDDYYKNLPPLTDEKGKVTVK